MTPLVAAAMRDACAVGQSAARRTAPTSRNRVRKASGRSPLAIAENKYEAAKTLIEAGANRQCRRPASTR